MTDEKHPLPGSERQALSGSRCIGSVDIQERFQISLIVRRPDQALFQQHVVRFSQSDAPASASRPIPLTHEEYAKRFGADARDLKQVRDFADQHHLQIISEDAVTRTLVLSGTVAQFNEAFGIHLQHYQHAQGHYHGHAGPVHLPAALTGIVTAVLGLDNRPQARAHFRFRPPIRPAQAETSPQSYTPLELAADYQFAPGTGEGECVGIIELGGGFDDNDLQTFFTKLGLPMPSVDAVSVGGAKNSPSGDADAEVMLDIEIVGALAPKAKLAVYFSDNSDQGFINAVNQAIHDTTYRPSVISISWGGPESSWTAQSLNAFDDVLQSAATLGITVCVAAGDNGSGDNIADGADHADFPASSPYALACGGTRLLAGNGTITSETVWNDGQQGGAGGGGISTHFPCPTWQKGLQATHSSGAKIALAYRGVPDVAGNASPTTGYQVLIHGQWTVVGGTSAVAPLWAGLIARINASAGKACGFVQPLLYPANACRDITQGNNGDFAASPGWDACTGLGSPNGEKVAALF